MDYSSPLVRRAAIAAEPSCGSSKPADNLRSLVDQSDAILDRVDNEQIAIALQRQTRRSQAPGGGRHAHLAWTGNRLDQSGLRFSTRRIR
jgi:hypothetical protein